MTISKIDDEEIIVRLVFNPEAYENGELKNIWFPTDHILKSNGVSVDRLDLLKESVVEKRIAEQTSKKPKERVYSFFVKFCKQQVNSIAKEIYTEGSLVELVEDPITKPLENENLAHALVKGGVEKPPKSKLRQFRDELTDIVEVLEHEEVNFYPEAPEHDTK